MEEEEESLAIGEDKRPYIALRKKKEEEERNLQLPSLNMSRV